MKYDSMRRFGREPIANAVRGFFRTLCADFRRLSPFRSSIEILLPKPTSKKVPIYGASWSERRDLNSGPPVPQTGALTGLRYAPPMPPDYSQRPSRVQSLQIELLSALNSLAGMIGSERRLPLLQTMLSGTSRAGCQDARANLPLGVKWLTFLDGRSTGSQS